METFDAETSSSHLAWKPRPRRYRRHPTVPPTSKAAVVTILVPESMKKDQPGASAMIARVSYAAHSGKHRGGASLVALGDVPLGPPTQYMST